MEGDSIGAFAPICRTELALSNLRGAIPHLNATFPKMGPFDAHAELLASTIEDAGYSFITIELTEIEDLFPPEHRFSDLFALAVRGFSADAEISLEVPEVEIRVPTTDSFDTSLAELDEGEFDAFLEHGGSFALNLGGETRAERVPGFSVGSHREVLELICQVRPQAACGKARLYLDNLAYGENEQWNFTRVLGAGAHGSMGYGREVLWEKEDADYGFDFGFAGSEAQESGGWLKNMFGRIFGN